MTAATYVPVAFPLSRPAPMHANGRLLVAIGAITAVSTAATLASPFLIGRAPLLLMTLSPRTAFLAIAASDTALVTFLAVGVVRLALTDPLHYVMGQRIGVARGSDAGSPSRAWRVADRLRAILHRVPRPLRFAARPACCVAVLLRPNGINLMWAGAQRLPKRLVAVLDLVGTVGYLLVVHTGATALQL